MQTAAGWQDFLKGFFLEKKQWEATHFERSVREAEDGIHHERQRKKALSMKLPKTSVGELTA